MTESPSTPSRRSLPRFRVSAHGRGGDEHVRPLPPTLLRRLAQTPEGLRHGDLGDRFSEVRTKIVALGTELQRARVADGTAERKAAEKGAKPPKPRAPQVEAELEESRRQLVVVEGLLEESASDLLRASVAHLGGAKAEAEGAVERALDEAADALRLAEERFAEAGEGAAESSWLGELAHEGTAHVWRGGGKAAPAPNALASLRKAVADLAYDREAAAERRERATREREAEEREKLPPGSTVWREGRTLVVGPAGEFQEAEEVER